MAGLVPYEDITEECESAYTQQGWTATRKFMFDGCDMSDPASTLQTLLNDSAVPTRGDQHPSGEDMQADEIRAKAVSSTQAWVTVTYKKLSAVEAEPDDSMPGLMTIGSTVMDQETPFDVNGERMSADYVSDNGGTPFWSVQSSIDGTVIPKPTVAVLAKTQIPNTIIRFARREQSEPSAKIKTYEGKINATPCQWGQLNAAAGTLLCTRIEGNTNDGGNSYVVEYEFQYNQGVNPQTGQETGWAFFTSFYLPNGTIATPVDGSPGSIGPGESPGDAGLQQFDIYPTAEFNNLQLV